MKSLLCSLFVFAFWLTTSEVKAQANYFNVGAEWYEEATNGVTPSCLWTYKIQYTLISDTVIANKTYYQLYYRRDEQNFFNNPSCGPTGLFSGYSYLLRQEGKKIIRQLNNVEDTLYDFDLNVGDTIIYRPNYEDIVVAIDSILIGNVWRKKFLLSNYNGSGVDYIIEGVGHSLGLFYPDNPGPYISYNSAMHCYRQDGITYPFLGANCSFDLSYVEVSLEPKIYPNPVSDVLTLSNVTHGYTDYQVVSISGKTVYQGRFEETYEINVADLKPGIYLLKVSNTSKVFRHRFMKI